MDREVVTKEIFEKVYGEKLGPTDDALTLEMWEEMKAQIFGNDAYFRQCRRRLVDDRKCNFCKERFECWTKSWDYV